MKKEKVYREGDILVVEFVKNIKKGRKPICMINGKVAFIVSSYRGEFIQEHSQWHVEILEIKRTTMVVEPIQMIKTAAETTRDVNIQMQGLMEKFKPAIDNTGRKVEFFHSKKRKLGKK